MDSPASDLKFPAMTLVQLKHFVTLANAGSFVRASGLLFITQPALSRSIKSLEDELGQLLFDRVGKRIELTPFGSDILKKSQSLLDDASQLKHTGRVLQPDDAGRLRLGLGSGPGHLLTVPLMVHFATAFPRFHIDIVRANTAALTQMLRDRQVDALVVDVRSLVPAPDLKVSQVVELDGAFLCRPNHALTKKRKLKIEDVLAYPLASTPLSDELARILVARYGELAHPLSMVKLTSDEISHLIQVAENTNAVVLAIRACGPQLVELQLDPPLRAQARLGMVTLSQRAEPLVLPEIRRLMEKILA